MEKSHNDLDNPDLKKNSKTWLLRWGGSETRSLVLVGHSIAEILPSLHQKTRNLISAILFQMAFSNFKCNFA